MQPFQKPILGFFASGLVLSNLAPANPHNLDFQVLSIRGLQLTAPTYAAVNSQKDWQALWNSRPGGFKPGPPPEIDFEHYTLIVAASGQTGGSGNSIALEEVRNDLDRLTVMVIEVGNRDCPRLTMLTYPQAFALIPKTGLSVIFAVRHTHLLCKTER